MITAMGSGRMHDDEVATDRALVRRLLADQFPQWSDLPVEPVVSYGTDHHIYRLGEELCVRLPRIEWATRQAAKEARWLPRLAPHLPLDVPVQLASGRPAEGYPFHWSVYEWLPGENANGTIDDLDQAAVDLAAFGKALRSVDTTGAHLRPLHARGGPLADGDESVRRSVTQLGNRIDAAAVLGSWQESLDSPPWQGSDVWVHGDLLPGNLLVVDGRLSAVIDFGGLSVGDPACDLLAGVERLRRIEPGAVPRRARRRRRVLAAWPGVGPLPGRAGAAVLLGHQPRDDLPGLARAGPGAGRQTLTRIRGLRACAPSSGSGHDLGRAEATDRQCLGADVAHGGGGHDGLALVALEQLADLAQDRGQRHVEGGAQRGEKLRAGFLLATLDLGDVPEADPRVGGHLPQREPAAHPVGTQNPAEHLA